MEYLLRIAELMSVDTDNADEYELTHRICEAYQKLSAEHADYELVIEYNDDGTQKTDTDEAQVNYLQNFLENDGTFMFKYAGLSENYYLRVAKIDENHYEIHRWSEEKGYVAVNDVIVSFTEVGVLMLKAMQGLSQQMNIMTTWQIW